MKRLLLLALLVAACAGSQVQVATPIPPAMGTAFTVDGFTITLTSLRRLRQVDPQMEPLSGTELWVLRIEAVNNTGREAEVGTGFRLQDDQGVIEDASLLSAVDPKFGADLAPGGKTSGLLTFSLPSTHKPVAVLVKPDSESVSVPIPFAPWPTPTPTAS